MITLGSLCLHAAQLMKSNRSTFALKKVDDSVQFGLIGKTDIKSTVQIENHLLPLLSVDVKSSVENDITKVGVTQLFKNDTTEILDVYYCLSIHGDGGSFVYFNADVEGVHVKDVSRLTVNDDDFENSGVSTGILEFLKWIVKGNSPGVYQIPIGSLNPGSSMQIRIGYEYKLMHQNKNLRFFIPRTIVPKTTFAPATLSIKITILVLGLIDALESPSHPSITVIGKFEHPQKKGWTQAQVKYSGIATDLSEDFVLLIERPEEAKCSIDDTDNNESDPLTNKYVKSFLDGFSEFKGDPILQTNVPIENKESGLCQKYDSNDALDVINDNDNIFATEDPNFVPGSIDYCIMKKLENSYIANRNSTLQLSEGVAKGTSESVGVKKSAVNTNNKISFENNEKVVVSHSVTNESNIRFCTNANSEMEMPETVPEDNSSSVNADSPSESVDPGNPAVKTEKTAEAKISCTPEVAQNQSAEAAENASGNVTQIESFEVTQDEFEVTQDEPAELTQDESAEETQDESAEVSHDESAEVPQNECAKEVSYQEQFLEDFQSFHSKAANAIETKKSLDVTTTENADKNNGLENQDGLIPDINLEPENPEECEKNVLKDSGSEKSPKEIGASLLNTDKDIAETTKVVPLASQKKFNFSQPRMTKLQVCRANLIAKNSSATISNKETLPVTSAATTESSQPKPKPAGVYRRSTAPALTSKDSQKVASSSVVKTSSYTSNLKKASSKSKNVTERPNTAKFRNASQERKKGVTFANANPPKPLVSDKDVSKILINLQSNSGHFELSPILTALLSQDMDHVRMVARDKSWTESAVGTALALTFFMGKLQDQKALWNDTYEKGKKWLTAHYPKKTEEMLEYMAQNVFNE